MTYHTFHVNQCDGLSQHHLIKWTNEKRYKERTKESNLADESNVFCVVLVVVAVHTSAPENVPRMQMQVSDAVLRNHRLCVNSDNGGGGVDKSPITPTHLIATYAKCLNLGYFMNKDLRLMITST